MRILRKLFKFLFLLLLILACVGVGYYFIATKTTVLQPEKLTLNEHTVVIYDKYGEEVQNTASFFHKQAVKVDHISKHVLNAVISTEDKRFYKHNGFQGRRVHHFATAYQKHPPFPRKNHTTKAEGMEIDQKA